MSVTTLSQTSSANQVWSLTGGDKNYFQIIFLLIVAHVLECSLVIGHTHISYVEIQNPIVLLHPTVTRCGN